MRYLIILIVGLSGVVDRCTQYSREELTIERSIYSTSAFKTKGLYYHVYGHSDNRKVSYLVFYQNGIVFGGNIRSGNLDSLLKELNDIAAYSQAVPLPFSWGVYEIQRNKLVYEKWMSGSGPGGPYPTRIFEAEILNDTTLLFKEQHYGKMHFHPLAEKPDSTNPFIK